MGLKMIDQNNKPEQFDAETASKTNEDERRIVPRKQTEDLSSIVVSIDGRTITCLVHNISETGAMVQTSVRDLPQRFVLDNPNEGIRRVCRVIWVDGDMTGVEFVKTSRIKT